MNLRRNLITWLCLVLAWQVACLIFWMIGIGYFNTVIGIATVEPIQLQEGFDLYLNSNLPYYEDALFGLLFGSFFFFIHWLIENTKLGKKSFGMIILIESVLYIIAFSTVFLLVAYTMSSTDIFPFEAYDVMIWMMIEHPSAIIAFGVYTALVIILLNFFLEVSKKFGPGNLWNLFVGKYHNPVVEEKIFMFLDLKDSTGYAERLGHIKYSRLIQNCFQDLNSIVGQHNAQIYQYVGDEVVLMWDRNDNGAAKDCIKLYYGFRDLLQSKSNKYSSRYGLVPEFKAGINQGSVTAAEVGNIKREIAFHGDVLNTASRIQKVCNQYKKNLLASEAFAELLSEVGEFRKVLIGYIPLKGKSVPINIYSIEPS